MSQVEEETTNKLMLPEAARSWLYHYYLSNNIIVGMNLPKKNGRLRKKQWCLPANFNIGRLFGEELFLGPPGDTRKPKS